MRKQWLESLLFLAILKHESAIAHRQHVTLIFPVAAGRQDVERDRGQQYVRALELSGQARTQLAGEVAHREIHPRFARAELHVQRFRGQRTRPGKPHRTARDAKLRPPERAGEIESAGPCRDAKLPRPGLQHRFAGHRTQVERLSAEFQIGVDEAVESRLETSVPQGEPAPGIPLSGHRQHEGGDSPAGQDPAGEHAAIECKRPVGRLAQGHRRYGQPVCACPVFRHRDGQCQLSVPGLLHAPFDPWQVRTTGCEIAGNTGDRGSEGGTAPRYGRQYIAGLARQHCAGHREQGRPSIRAVTCRCAQLRTGKLVLKCV